MKTNCGGLWCLVHVLTVLALIVALVPLPAGAMTRPAQPAQASAPSQLSQPPLPNQEQPAQVQAPDLPQPSSEIQTRLPEGEVGLAQETLAAQPLTLLWGVEPDLASPGEVVTFTAAIANESAASLRAITLTVPLPTGLVYVPNSATGFGYSAPDQRLTWSVAELGLGELLTGTFQTRVGGLPLGTTVSVTVTATAATLPQPVSATVTLPIVEPASNDTWITPAGGWFRSADGRVRLHIPPGAVAARTRFTYAPLTSLPNRPANLRLAFSLEAHDESGQPVRRFAAPLALTFCYTPQSLSSQIWEEPSLWYFSEAAQTWLPVPIRVDYRQKRLSANLEHFTVFAQTSDTYMVERMSSVRGAQTSLFTGAESYRYSLELPPGRAGLVPALGFSYSSANHTPASGHFSLAGFGWEIVGADSVYIPPGDANLGKPVLSLQGTTYSLRQTSDGTWFAKENPFLKIQVADVSYSTPGTWYVWTPDGTKYTFGTDQNPRSHYWKLCNTPDHGKRYVRLPLTRIDDPNGNVVTYTWQGETENSRVYVCEIDWITQTYTRFVRLASISYNNSQVQVVFNYASRDDRPEGYDCDECWTFHTDKRLTSVAVQAYSGGAWNTIRTYTLQQSSGPASAVTQKVLNLDWLEESSGGYALPRTELAYTDNYFSVQNAFGAIITITNGYGGAVVFQSDHRGGNETNAHVVATRTEKAGVSGVPDSAWTYAYGVWDYDPNNLELAQGYKNVTVTLPLSGTEAYAFHTLLLAGDGQKIDHLAGREYQTQVLAGAQELVKNLTTWVSTTLNLPISGYSGMPESAKPRFVYADTVDAYQDGQTILRRQYYYQIERQGGSKQFGNVTEAREYAGTGGGWESLPIRTNYTWYYPNETTWITAKPGRTDLYKVCAGCTGGQWVGQSLLYYDQATDYQTPPTKGLLSKRRDGMDAEQVTTAQYEYWANGNLRKVKDGNNNTTETFYDSSLQACPVCVKNQLGHLTKARYYGVPGSTDAGCTTADGSAVWSGGQPIAGRFFGLVEEVLDPNNAKTTSEYDWWGRPTKVWRPGEDKASGHSATQVFAYTNYGGANAPFKLQKQQRDDPNGGGSAATYLDTWSFFDGLGRVIQSQAEAADAGQSILVNTFYNGLDKVVTQTLPYLYSAAGGSYRTPDWSKPKKQYAYDALGRTTQVTNPDGTTVRTYYQDRKTAILDELNHQTIREVDALGRLVAAKQYEGTYSTPNWSATVYAQATYTYNVRDQLTDVYDPANNRTQIWYDTLGRKTSMSDPDMGAWQYRYDAAGNLTKQRDARNQAICFYYDGLNRLVGKTYHSGISNLDTLTCPGTPYAVSYTYDQGTNGKGRRTAMSDGSGNTSWTYDARGRVTQETKVINGTGGGTFKTQLSYYADDQVYTLRYPADNQGNLGETVTTTYNPMGLVKSVAGTSTYVGDTSYNARGQVELRKLGSTTGVLTTDYVYRTDNFRLQWIKTGPTSPFEGLQNLEYTYDAVGNVQSIKDYKVPGGTQTQSFTYDALDRLLSATVTGGNTGQGQYSEVYTYNAIGNLTRKGDLLYDYYSNRPHAVYCTYYPPYYGYGTYGYDANGNMTSRTVLGTSYALTYDAENRLTGVSGGTSATFVYDGDGKRVKATFGANNTAYVGDYFEWTGSTSTMVKYYYANGQRVAMRVGSTLYYLLSDHLGSTAITANDSGGKYAELRYRAYGETRYSDGTTPTTYRFTGQREEATIGLYFYGARWYDQAIGRFVQADTIVPEPGNPQALNRYSYSLNNPLRYRDPSGHWVETVWDILNIGWDIYEVKKDPSLVNIGALVLDVAAAALPFVPGGVGMVVRGGKAAKAAVEVATHADDVVDVAKVGKEAAEKATVQMHHLLSEKIVQALGEHKTLKGVFNRKDPSLISQALDYEAHHGYQTWHRELDDEVVKWLSDDRHAQATPEEFLKFLQELYQRPDIKARIPMVDLTDLIQEVGP